ncbi:molybdopterin synthase catalytic subunit [Marininema mesophilum]|uniref:Molybdopterin synthase catalytic subunit n=1 Tax=Marininema mesophilum TaxID=1048340 RepID=A0A1H3AXC5_9BACL|nr:molybdopterin converting factor subunit 1 [Marininema mesophilum]SDX34071.1 molybdopterin synthase catalytic subunit [Marininema mesophilum]
MQITIFLFAGIAETLGQRDLHLDLPEGSTVQELTQQLAMQYPQITEALQRSVVACNEEYASPTQRLQPGDEVAIIPPVSGGQEEGERGTSTCFITRDPLCPESLMKQVSNPRAGAILTFAGTVREFTGDQQTIFLEYDAYIPMALRQMELIRNEIKHRWPEVETAIAHRIGRLEIGEISVLIAVASPHRAISFAAGEYAIERLKETVPIWKKEVWKDGSTWKGPQTEHWNPQGDESRCR